MISLLCPTRKRPERLRVMIDSVARTYSAFPPNKGIEVLCYVADDDDSYDRLIHPEDSGMLRFPVCGIYFDAKRVTGPRLTMSDLWNALIPHATGDIFMLCADDVIFRTPGWDLEIEKVFAAVPDKILLAFADDGGPSGKVFATLPFVSRRWVEVVGYFTGPGFSADFSDTWPQDVAEMIGRKTFVSVLIEHMHTVWGKAPDDQTYRENRERYERDLPNVLYAKRLPERQRDAAKLRAAMHS